MAALSSLVKLSLNPVVSGALLLALTQAPASVREPLIDALRPYISPINLDRTVTGLKWLFGLGLYGIASKWLGDLAQNNFRLRSERHRYDWPKEIAVVTGAASGFGRLISESLASHGVNIMALDLGDSLPKDMQSNPKIHYYKCDVTDPDTVNKVAAQIRSEHGDPSILINNAGIAFDALITDCKPAQVRRIFDVNIISHYYTIGAFVPAMIKAKKGHVVTLASMASFISTPPIVAYCNTKVAALSLHEGLTNELRSKKMHNAPEVKTTVVHPTFAATAMTTDFADTIQKSGMELIDPRVVSDAVVGQILKCKGGQIILNGKAPDLLSGIRGWPHWISSSLMNLVFR